MISTVTGSRGLLAPPEHHVVSSPGSAPGTSAFAQRRSLFEPGRYGSSTRTRIWNRLINSQLLHRLSYRGSRLARAEGFGSLSVSDTAALPLSYARSFIMLKWVAATCLAARPRDHMVWVDVSDSNRYGLHSQCSDLPIEPAPTQLGGAGGICTLSSPLPYHWRLLRYCSTSG